MHTSNLRFFLDTADVLAWEKWLPTGIFYGVTTNPSLLEKAKVPCHQDTLLSLANKAFELGAKEVQIQTWGQSIQDMVTRGRAFSQASDRIVIKIPLTESGIRVARQLQLEGRKVTLTAAYNHHQAIVADAASAEYIAPYLGRMTDLGFAGHDEIVNMQRSLTALNSTTRILVASIRSIEDITELTMHGLTTFTFSPAIAEALFDVLPTKKAATEFERAAQAMQI